MHESLVVVEREIKLPTSEGFITIAGSRSYNTDLPESDWDYRGFFFPEPKHILGFRSGLESKSWIANGEDFCLWEIRKFMKLALACNPNVLETLFADPRDYVACTPSAAKLLNYRDLVLSRRIASSFVGVATANWKKIEKAEARKEPWLGKDAMHMVRYLTVCERTLRTGKMFIKEDAATRVQLLGIRNKEVGYASLNDTRNELMKKIDDITPNSILPEDPDEKKLNEVLVDLMADYVRKSHDS